MANIVPFLMLVVGFLGILPGDFDGDFDVDLLDYQQFASCVSGPDVPYEPGICQLADIEPAAHPDGDVDLRDFAAFQRYYTGSF